jgi:hypothetical protein
MSEDPYIVRKIKEAIDDHRTGVDHFGKHSVNCPLHEDGYCLAHNITTSCNIVDCPIEDIDVEALEVDISEGGNN